MPIFFKKMIACLLVGVIQFQSVALAATPVECGSAQKNAAATSLVKAVEAEKNKQIEEITERKRIHDLMVQNAVTCMQELARLINMIAFPSIPNFADGIIDSLIKALMARACKVILKEANKVVKEINKPFEDIQGEIDRATGDVNRAFDKSTGETGTKVLENGKSFSDPNKPQNKKSIDDAAGLAGAATDKLEEAGGKLNDAVEKLRCLTQGGCN